MGISNLSERFKKEVHLFVQDGELSDSEKRVLFEIAEEDGIDEKVANHYIMEEYKVARHRIKETIKVEEAKRRTEELKRQKNERKRTIAKDVISVLLTAGGLLLTALQTTKKK